MAAKSGLDIITALKFLKLRDLKQRAALTAYLVRRAGLLTHIDKWNEKLFSLKRFIRCLHHRHGGSKMETLTLPSKETAFRRGRRRSICKVRRGHCATEQRCSKNTPLKIAGLIRVIVRLLRFLCSCAGVFFHTGCVQLSEALAHLTVCIAQNPHIKERLLEVGQAGGVISIRWVHPRKYRLPFSSQRSWLYASAGIAPKLKPCPPLRAWAQVIPNIWNASLPSRCGRFHSSA